MKCQNLEKLNRRKIAWLITYKAKTPYVILIHRKICSKIPAHFTWNLHFPGRQIESQSKAKVAYRPAPMKVPFTDSVCLFLALYALAFSGKKAKRALSTHHANTKRRFHRCAGMAAVRRSLQGRSCIPTTEDKSMIPGSVPSRNPTWWAVFTTTRK